MACRSCDLKRIYKLFEEKKRREAEEAKALAEAAELERKQGEERVHKKKSYEPVEAVVEAVEEPATETIEKAKEEISVESEIVQPEESFETI